MSSSYPTAGRHARRAMVVALAAFTFGAASIAAGAAPVIYTQPVVLTGEVAPSQNDPTSFGAFATAYDNFQFDPLESPGATITDVHWTGGFTPGSETQASITAFTIQFWNNVSGAPGTSLYSATITGNAGQTNQRSCASIICFDYAVDLATPFHVVAGTTYWLSVVPTMVFPPSWFWQEGSGGDGSAVLDFINTPRETLDFDLAFNLTGTLDGPVTVPEPATLALLGLGLAGLGLSRRRKPG